MTKITCQCEVCREIAQRRAGEAREMVLIAVAWMASRHGLDDADAMLHVLLHGVDGTRSLQ
jgi:hypothetical protein